MVLYIQWMLFYARHHNELVWRVMGFNACVLAFDRLFVQSLDFLSPSDPVRLKLTRCCSHTTVRFEHFHRCSSYHLSTSPVVISIETACLSSQKCNVYAYDVPYEIVFGGFANGVFCIQIVYLVIFPVALVCCR